MKGVDTCACREDILGQCGHACLLEVRTPPHTPVYWRTGQTLLVGGLVVLMSPVNRLTGKVCIRLAPAPSGLTG